MGARFRHADGTEYGQALKPEAQGAQGKLFHALRGLGFREREVRAVLAEPRPEAPPPPTVPPASPALLLERVHDLATKFGARLTNEDVEKGSTST